ncbi:UDP-2,3-diacylglucosamine diphosphatase [Nitrospirillum sp. BR 11163]|uniref:UDP-2,3-diacylglucosamine diphosphatase n=1 Tax=Nitrospirillum sp. BR 11163 TaxID=3104323 RepID=UPI002AFFF912|nr:UDP-2,3-diacylglucosamine diphosphatase [Nitrospirillum sp. BR 11163]MEA1677114.1 UDP-2,3-diacylglucosamine diphosphatase [Nitrospirillum sp. BR 11163]
METDMETEHEAPRRYRSIWLSDLHLGTRGCQADMLLDFLKHTELEYLYLVGDIVDGWRLKKGWYWPQAHNDVVQKVLRRVRKGTKVFLIPGNHDEVFRDFIGLQFGGVTILEDAVHTTADGRRFLVLHGDLFDAVVKYAKWLAYVGDSAYTVLLTLNTWLNTARRHLGFQYWSLSAYLKNRTKKAVEFIGNYEQALADEAKRRQVDGIICGHIHHAEMRDMGGVLYCNDGDWVESCTALVEHADGTLEIIHWADEVRKRAAARQPGQPGGTTQKAAA